MKKNDSRAIRKRRKWRVVAPALILFTTVIFAAPLIPPTYRSSATLLLECRKLPPPLSRTTVGRDAEEYVQVIGQSRLTADTLRVLIERYDLYPDLRQTLGLDAAVEKMRRRIALEMLDAERNGPQIGGQSPWIIRFSVSFEDGSAHVARIVTQELVSRLLGENRKPPAAETPSLDAVPRTQAERLGAEIGALQAKIAALESSGDYARVVGAPQRQALLLEYHTALAKYRELREQWLQAELSQALEQDQADERLSLLEPPRAAEQSFASKRWVVTAFGLVLAGVVGIGTSVRLQHLDKRMRGAHAIQLATPIPLLAVVPFIETARDRQARLKRIVTLIGAALMFALIAMVGFHHALMPLDALWSILMHRIEAGVPGRLN